MVTMGSQDPLAGLTVALAAKATTTYDGESVRPVWNEITLNFSRGPVVILREIWVRSPFTDETTTMIVGGVSTSCCASPQESLRCPVCFGELPSKMFHGWDELTRELLVPYFSRLGPLQGEFAVAWALEFSESLAVMGSQEWAALPKLMELSNG